MKNIDLYLDLDGVILRRTGRTDFKGRNEFVVAPGAMEFLSWAIDHFNCYWLTSRSHDGRYVGIERAFRFAVSANSLPEEIMMVIHAIAPAPWGKLKIEGIDQSRNFYWVDDNPNEDSVSALVEIGLSSRLIVTSTDERPNDLIRVRRLLEKVTANDQTIKQRCHTMENTELLETKLGTMNYFFYYATIMMTFISHNGFYVFL